MHLFGLRIPLSLSACLVSASLLLTGCASVEVSTVDSAKYMTLQRGDIISTGELSQPSTAILYTIDYTPEKCKEDFSKCLKDLSSVQQLEEEQLLAAMAEIWLFRAMHSEKRHDDPYAGENASKREKMELIEAYLEAGRYAYAYLFFSNRPLANRALEDRQTQVRDYYNYAVQKAVEHLFQLSREVPKSEQAKLSRIGNWDLSVSDTQLPKLGIEPQNIEKLIPDTTLTFKGLRNQYIREGIGSRMVLEKNTKEEDEKVWRSMPYVSSSVLIEYQGKNLKEVKETNKALIIPFEAFSSSKYKLGKNEVPLGANFSSAYGLWLANSDFSKQSLGTVFGKGNVLDKATVFLMQPYDPKKRTIILIHGLASSPEAWVNAANEITGDDTLRDNYQTWQIYYPTSVPVIMNRHDIAKIIEETLDHYDPQRKNPASRDMVLIGHSMGGILSRLLVSDSGDKLWSLFEQKEKGAVKNPEEARKRLAEYFEFKPLPEVTTAVFLAAPHRGTPFADKSFAKWLASFVKLPLSIIERVGEMTLLVFGQEIPPEKLSMTGVDNLSAKDPVIIALSDIPISSKVRYHSIIGDNDGPDVPVKDSSDGIVPYWSSHWDGAESEVVVESGHSVQETPKAILEIRRILHEHLQKSQTPAKKKSK